MAKELQVKEFSALPVADDGKTLLYADGEVKQSRKNLSEMLTDEVNNKLDTTAFSTVSGSFLTAHQVIPSGKWENVSDVVIANSATWGTETDWTDDISAASGYALSEAKDWVEEQNYITCVDLTNYYTKSETSGKEEIEAALEEKQDKLTFSGENNTITSINNSAIGGGVGGAGGDYVPLSAIECTIGSGNLSELCSLAQGENNSAGSAFSNTETVEDKQIEYINNWGYSFAQGKDNLSYSSSLAQGVSNSATHGSFAQGLTNYSNYRSVCFGENNSAEGFSFSLGNSNTAYENSFAQGSTTTATWYSVAIGSGLSASNYSFNFGVYNFAEKYSQTFGYGLKATNYATAYGYKDAVVTLGSFVIGEFNKTSAAPFVIGNGTSDNTRSDLFVVDKDGNVSTQGQIYAAGGVLGASLDTLELAPDNETIEFVTSSYNVVNGEGEPEEYTVIKIKTSLLEKINELYNLVSSNSGTSNWNLPQ